MLSKKCSSMNEIKQNGVHGWQDAFEVMKQDHGLTNDGLGVFAINLRFGLDDIQTIASEAITGGGDDKKCDVLYVDKERQIAVVAQCYTSPQSKSSAPANKAADLNTAVTWLLSADIDTLPEGLRGRADELRSAIYQGDVKQLHLWYVHNLPCSHNVGEELRTVEKTARAALKQLKSDADVNVFSEEVCRTTLERLYLQAERTVIVTDTFHTTVPDAFEIESEEWTSVATVVSGRWLKKLYQDYQTDLFSANLRGYLGSRESDSNINNGIKSTATHDPANFCVYNNGITALVLDYELARRRKSGRKLTIRGLSIVNGAQTTGSISSLDTNVPVELKIPIRFVKAKRESVVANVVRYNNTQNKIQAADFRSTDPIQERLRVEFKSIPEAEYEGGRRGGASDIIKRSKYTLPSYTVGQALAAFHGDPVTAYDKKSELWTTEKNYRQIFTERTSARHIVFCYSLLSGLINKKTELRRLARETQLTASQDRILLFLNKKGSAYLMVWVASQCMETILGKAIANKADLQFRENVPPAQGEKMWQPITDLLLSLSMQLDNAFSRDRISNESIKDAVPSFVGVVESLREIHEQTFKKFASAVEIRK